MVAPEPHALPSDRLAEVACTLILREMRQAIAERGVCHLALPGGSAAQVLLPRLADSDNDWGRTHFYWGDERAVPLEHQDSNFRLAEELLLSRIEIPQKNLHPMRTSLEELEDSAAAYERELRSLLGPAGCLDLVLLGCGPDGHICSLFPGHELCDESERWVASLRNSPKPPAGRVTVTFPLLEKARRVVVVATGTSKAPALREALSPGGSTPLARVLRFGSAEVFADLEASSEL